MNRRNFLKKSGFGLGGISIPTITKPLFANNSDPNNMKQNFYPLAITMWDFSWLERRWPGAGYEDWEKILDELVERGYNAVRVDAYPHLVSTDPEKLWTLLPHWTVQDWGSPSLNMVQVQPALNSFISLCNERNILVGLSTWYRKDEDDVRMKISSPEIMANQWLKTLQSIDDDGLLDSILYVDLCNEWPGDAWAPFFTNNPPEITWGAWDTENSMDWMQRSVKIVKSKYPDLPICYSFDLNNPQKFESADVSFLDFLEPHIWMVQGNNGEFYKKTGYSYDLFEHTSYNNLVKNGEKLYRSDPEYWNKLLMNSVQSAAYVSEITGKALVTTECWAVVDYKDWPLLNWDWVKDLCAIGVKTAVSTGRWTAMSTSNFCGPQFKGMWRDVHWHKELTALIKNSNVSKDILGSNLVNRVLKIS